MEVGDGALINWEEKCSQGEQVKTWGAFLAINLSNVTLKDNVWGLCPSLSLPSRITERSWRILLLIQAFLCFFFSVFPLLFDILSLYWQIRSGLYALKESKRN